MSNKFVSDINQGAIQLITQALPNVLAIYVFGSRVGDNSMPESDLDMAVLVAGYANTVTLWNLAMEIANSINCDVDLLDMRAASTVMQYQILSTGLRIWQSDEPEVALNVGLYECAMLSEMTTLNEARAGLIADIQESGSIYGR
jgi:uncharacterized protein